MLRLGGFLLSPVVFSLGLGDVEMKVPREIEAESDEEVESDEIAAVPGVAVDGEVDASDCYGLGEYSMI